MIVMGVAGIAFKGICQINELIRNGTDAIWASAPSEGLSVARGSLVSSGPRMIFRSTLPAILDASVVNAIKNLFQLPWVTRIWVLQEFGLATVATACWGSSHVDFQEIGEFIHHAMLHENLDTLLRQEVKDVISGSQYHALHNVWFT